MKKIKAVIFDLDGTIANTLPLAVKAFRKAIEPLINRYVTDEEIYATFGPTEEGTIKALIPDHYNEGVEGYLSNYESLHSTCPEPFEGITDLLYYLREHDIKTAMVTGKGRRSADISLEYFKLTPFFEILETGSIEGPIKPKGIRNVLEAFPEIAKDEIIYVGDAPSDITACKEVGIPIVAAAWAETAEPEKLIPLKPAYIYYDVSDFVAWLKANI